MKLRVSWSQFWIALIAAGSLCGGRASGEEKEIKQFRDGDIILGAALQLSLPSDDGKCGRLLTSGIQLIETLNLIVDQVNANDSVLPGVRLGTVVIDTCGTDAIALRRVIREILPLALHGRRRDTNNSLPILAGVIGSSRSSVSTQLAKLLGVFKIPQISHWSTSVELSDKYRFPYFFRIVPPDNYQVSAMMKFVTDQGWNYVSIVYDDDAYGVSGYQEIARGAETGNVCISGAYPLAVQTTASDYISIINKLLKKENSRVAVLFTSSRKAEKLISTANSMPEAQDQFVWIAADAWVGFLPTTHDDISYIESLHGCVGFTPKFSTAAGLFEYVTNRTLEQSQPDNKTGESYNPWFGEYISERNNCSLANVTDITKRKCRPDEHLDPAKFQLVMVPIADAVHAMVQAIAAYHTHVCGGRRGVCQDILDMAGTNKMASGLFYHLKNISFTGADGKTFKFDKNQDGPAIYDAFMYDKGRVDLNKRDALSGWIKVGTYENHSLNWTEPIHDKFRMVTAVCSEKCKGGEIMQPQKGFEACCWYCEKCYEDQFIYNSSTCALCPEDMKPNKTRDGCEYLPRRLMEYSSGYSILPLTLGSFGLLLTILMTVVYVIYRETAIVRASGKELCFFVLFGVFLTLLSCFSITSYPTAWSCGVSRVVLALGPAIMYVGLLMKTARVVFIFQSKGILSSRTKTYLQPLPYICLTICVAAVQCFVLVVWFITHYPAPEWKVNSGDKTLFLTCKNLVEIDILIGLIYPFAIIVICTILATVNRNVPTGFKETLYVGFSMYTTCVIWLTFLPIFLTNKSDFPKKLTTVSVALTLSAITILVCLFGPRCFVILFHPEDNTPEIVMSRAGSRSCSVKERSKSTS